MYSIREPSSLARCPAILAWEPTAVFSHRTAAWLWHMLPEPTVFEATVRPSLHKAPPPWVRLYRRELSPEEVTESWDMPTVGPYYADFLDTRARLVVEVDGREFHNDPVVFRRDRRRQNWMLLEGFLVLRYAAADVFESVSAVADEVILVARRRRKALG